MWAYIQSACSNNVGESAEAACLLPFKELTDGRKHSE